MGVIILRYGGSTIYARRARRPDCRSARPPLVTERSARQVFMIVEVLKGNKFVLKACFTPWYYCTRVVRASCRPTKNIDTIRPYYPRRRVQLSLYC
jgi:hypothetical protein